MPRRESFRRALAVCSLCLPLLGWRLAVGQQQGDSPAAGCPTSRDCQSECEGTAGTRREKIESLRQAIEHLQAAGLQDEAQRLHQLLEEEKSADHREQLERTLAELEAVQADVDRLRRLTGQARQVLTYVKLVEMDLDRLERLREDAGQASKTSTPNTATSVAASPDQQQGDSLERFFSKSELEQFITRDGALSPLLKRLRREGVIKVLAATTQVTTNGRPSQIFAGGEFPVPLPAESQELVEWREFGTIVECVPTVLDNGRLRVELQPEITRLKFERGVQGGDHNMPALTTARIHTQMEFDPGRTVVIGGEHSLSRSNTHRSKPTRMLFVPLLRCELMYPTENSGPCPDGTSADILVPAGGRANCAATDAPQTVPAATKIHHLRSAAAHLESAGLQEEADRIRRQANRDELELKIHRLNELGMKARQLRKLSGQTPQILVQCRILHVPLAKLRETGVPGADKGTLSAALLAAQRRHGTIDPVALASPGDSGVIPAGATHDHVPPIEAAVIPGHGRPLDATIREWTKQGLVKVLADPALVTTEGRPAQILSGGEFEVPVSRRDGEKWTTGRREFGLQMEVVPIVLGADRLRLEVQCEINEQDYSQAARIDTHKVPSLKTRRVNSQVEFENGQTIVLGGMVTQGADGAECETLVLIRGELIQSAGQLPHTEETQTSPRPKELPTPVDSRPALRPEPADPPEPASPFRLIPTFRTPPQTSDVPPS